MVIFPAIELKNGLCVSLRRGRMDDPLIWHVDPVEKAREFARTGAEWMHVTDLDAVDGDDRNRELVIEIIRQAGIPVQLAGGFRSAEAVYEGVEIGAGRIVIGTAAVRTPDLVKRAGRLYPDQIVLAVDAYKGKVLTDGWRKTSMFDVLDFVRAFDRTPLSAILFTDVGVEAEETDLAMSDVASVAAATKTPVIASGLVRSLDDISTLKYIGTIHGAIVGRALFNRQVDLAEALDVATPRPEKVADFL
ncbi:MAG: 1-(5-phosphoribosyl)-5-[(5-phosphoribosylamino)methylideneamino] imidazole-4-carboxamide isomerase [Paracoccaceae bacterium]|nr:1-(5-phosphoribosyl)-5-[(5-phosphoribosylamino)methylideneamino] imidazole-4-carboxamide isomerase [Paracoccaceae bacterium]MDE2914860.1 1-(5-phosphoribosyl)-5-[(5-phosphoribosylamino)methylideneamino] imidazole-4-carboxamide isomerase [Paracoccaceae bacterium]